MECLLAVVDYDNLNDAGTQLQFRKNADAPVETISMLEVKELGIGQAMKFIRAEVEVEDSSLYDTSLSVSGEPIWKIKNLLLRLWVEGNASLYSYQSEKGEKFFFSVADKSVPITQLLFIRWRPSKDVFKERKDYQQQLYKNLGCIGWSIADFTKLVYAERDLREFFEQANAKCSVGKPVTVFRNNVDNRFQIRLSAEMGLRTINLEVSSTLGRIINESYRSISPGLEFEVVALSGRLTGVIGLDFFKIDDSPPSVITRTSGASVYYETQPRVNLWAINIPIGLRLYAWNTPRNKLFLDASVVFCRPEGYFSQDVRMYVFDEVTAVQRFKSTADPNFSFNFGAGYAFNSKWGARVVLATQKNYFVNIATGNSEAISNDMRFALRYTFY
ncbi:MAG TPA: hypothetical protein VK183_07390 [Flavobacterium sp.]|nr:hypothetical protein [Flavobacterium sp.]